jgi:hypothetical protein
MPMAVSNESQDEENEMFEPAEQSVPSPTMWKKSSRSTHDNCVEVAFLNGQVRVRDSKNRGPVLKFTTGEWEAFTGGVRDGEFDLPTGG